MTDIDTLEITRHWQAGETGCGQLIVGLKRQIGQMQAGDLLKVTALDAGAPADLPAWCRMTGHALVSADHPNYVLKVKDDQIRQ
jgi:tRNA 2-thiouridine synthesizing protein A